MDLKGHIRLTEETDSLDILDEFQSPVITQERKPQQDSTGDEVPLYREAEQAALRGVLQTPEDHEDE